jgi:hypothetical protein
MELFKSEFSNATSIDKIVLKCDNDYIKYLNLIDFLHKSLNENAIILRALYDNKKDIVLKISNIKSIINEYDISKILKNMQNFISYYYWFTCNDNIVNIINNERMIKKYKLCNYGSDPIGILVMNYYKIGSIGEYEWTEYNFHILKNVLMQTSFAIIYAYDKYNFIHGDLHVNNILLKPKAECELTYEYINKTQNKSGSKQIIIYTYIALIMDFEKSKINATNEIQYMVMDLQKLLSSACNTEKSKISLSYDLLKLRKIKKKSNTIISISEYYDIIEDIIMNMEIDFAKN